jgi:DNA repair exonuclease SbcCD ATPase subunit
MPEDSVIENAVRVPCWRSLEIEGFRGFRRMALFDLNASALIVHGPNGTGKTSFFDAIQWLLVGDLPRLRVMRMRQTEEYIKNAYTTGPARVSAELVLRGRRVRISRTGDRTGNELSLDVDDSHLRGAAAETRLGELFSTGTGSSLQEVLFSSALLQQDDLRYVLTASPGDRFEQLSRLLGLGALERFETDALQAAKAQEASRKSARQAAEQVEARLNAARSELARVKDDESKLPAAEQLLAGLASDLTQLSPSTLRMDVPLTPDDVSKLSRTASLVEGRLGSLLAASQHMERLQSQLPGGSLEALTQQREVQAANHSEASEALSARRLEIAALERVLTAARRDADAFSQLVSLATPLLGERCPVCENLIDPIHVRESLLERATDATALTAMQGELAAARAAQDRAEASLREAAAALSTTERALTAVEEWRQARSEVEQDWTQLLATERLLAPSTVTDRTAPTLGWIAAALNEVASWRRSVDATATALAALARGSRLSAARDEVARAEEIAAAAKSAWEAAALAAAEADVLAKASTRARLQVIKRRVSALQPVADDIYSRLDPHPTFQRFQFESEVFRNKGTMSPRAEDEAAGVSVSPSLAFSSAQANMTALTYFLALAWATGHQALPFICLDDPLQDMDEVNVLAFTDLARHLREDRQLILATHERRFTALLRRKLAPRTPGGRLRLITFTGWSREGPEFNEELVDRAPVSDLRLLA